MPTEQPGPQPPLDVSSHAEVILRDPTPLRAWSLSAFADLVELGEESRYRLSEPSVRRALAAGFDTRQISTYLGKEIGKPLPAEVEALLTSWSKETRRVRIGGSITITPDDPSEIAALTTLFESAGQRARRLGDDTLVVDVIGENGGDRAIELLRAHGYLTIEPGIPGASPGAGEKKLNREAKVRQQDAG